MAAIVLFIQSIKESLRLGKLRIVHQHNVKTRRFGYFKRFDLCSTIRPQTAQLQPAGHIAHVLDTVACKVHIDVCYG